MPRQYLAMRDTFKTQGLSDAAAKTKAAKIFNAKHPRSPLRGPEKHKKAPTK